MTATVHPIGHPMDHPLAAPARAWFETLRDRLCAAFKAIEDELDAGPHAALPPGRFERTAWARPSGEGGDGGGGAAVPEGNEERAGAPARAGRAARLEAIGFEPTTPCLQSRCSPG